MSSANRFKKQGQLLFPLEMSRLKTDNWWSSHRKKIWPLMSPILMQPTSMHALTPSIPDSEFLKDFLLPKGDLSSKARTPGYCDKCQANTGDQCETAGLFLIYAGSECISVWGSMGGSRQRLTVSMHYSFMLFSARLLSSAIPQFSQQRICPMLCHAIHHICHRYHMEKFQFSPNEPKIEWRMYDKVQLNVVSCLTLPMHY